MGLSNDVLLQTQNRLLDMAKQVTSILTSNNLPYAITCGTLLGAVRHKGFLPWDDDFDINLFSDTYDESIEVLRKNLSSDLFLEDEKSEKLYFHGWAHVKDKKSIAECEFHPQDSLYSHKGISLDLYRFDKMKLKDYPYYVYNEKMEYFKRLLSKKIINSEEYEKRISETSKDSNQNDKLSDKEVLAFGACLRCCFDVDKMLPLKLYKFEDHQFYGPADADYFLRLVYGDYLKIPPVSKQKTHYSSVTFL